MPKIFFSLFFLIAIIIGGCSPTMKPFLSVNEVEHGNKTPIDGVWILDNDTNITVKISDGILSWDMINDKWAYPGGVFGKNIRVKEFPKFNIEVATTHMTSFNWNWEFGDGEIEVTSKNNILLKYFPNKSTNLKKIIYESFTLKRLDNPELFAKYYSSSLDVQHKFVIKSQDEFSKYKINFDMPTANSINKDAVAVIIGNRNYSSHSFDVPDISFAHNDADIMKKYLVESLGYREGNVIFLKDAAQGQLVSTFGSKENPKGTLYSWVRPEKSDVFVYYSGHGAPGLQSGKGYLLPVDANPATVELNGYPLEVLYQNLSKIPARSMTVVIDACFSGGSDGGTVVKNASSIALRRVDSSGLLTNGVVFSAASADEVASWDKESKLGLFTRYFLEGISGQADAPGFGNQDGQVSSSELKKYLESEVSYMARRMYLREQHPQVAGTEEVVFSTLK